MNKKLMIIVEYKNEESVLFIIKRSQKAMFEIAQRTNNNLNDLIFALQLAKMDFTIESSNVITMKEVPENNTVVLTGSNHTPDEAAIKEFFNSKGIYNYCYVDRMHRGAMYEVVKPSFRKRFIFAIILVLTIAVMLLLGSCSSSRDRTPVQLEYATGVELDTTFGSLKIHQSNKYTFLTNDTVYNDYGVPYGVRFVYIMWKHSNIIKKNSNGFELDTTWSKYSPIKQFI